MHSHAGTELLTSIKDLSFNIKIYGTTLEDNFKRKKKNLKQLQNIVKVLIFL